MSDTAHAKQGKNHSTSSESKAAESSPKAAISAAAATRVPAWANAWGNQLPPGLFLKEATLEPGSLRSAHASGQPGNAGNPEEDTPATSSSKGSTQEAVISRMEHAFGIPFNNVHIRTDETAAR